MAFDELMGEGTELTALQLGVRAFLVFIITTVLLRLAGQRAFGMRSTFDIVISILLGAVMSRAVVGASPFIPTIFGAIVIVFMYRTFAWFSLKSKIFGRLVKGQAQPIYQDGEMYKANMDRCLITEKDLLERVHYEANVDTIDEIDKAYLERDGAISIIKKTEKNHDI